MTLQFKPPSVDRYRPTFVPAYSVRSSLKFGEIVSALMSVTLGAMVRVIQLVASSEEMYSASPPAYIRWSSSKRGERISDDTGYVNIRVQVVPPSSVLYTPFPPATNAIWEVAKLPQYAIAHT